MKYFPYDSVRLEQDELVSAVESTLATKQSLVAHAPTGLGKTAAALAPAVERALQDDLVVLFLTGRHTQHQIALDTLRAMKEKHALSFTVVDLIGKQWFCLQPGVEALKGRAFHEYCKAMKGDKQCEYFENLKEGEQISNKTKMLLEQLGKITPITTSEVKSASYEAKLCPYEVTLLLARSARVIITDYQYVFNERIREGFLGKIGRTLPECIVIVDEAHNLPDRVKDLGSDFLSTIMLSRAISEAEKGEHEELLVKLRALIEVLNRLAIIKNDRGVVVDGPGERYVRRDEFLNEVERIHNPTLLLEWLERVGDSIREEQKQSAIGGVAEFLRSWIEGEEMGYTRILSREQGRQEFIITLSYKCLDPSVITREVFDNCHSSILMSGTLTPPNMYAQLLGVSEPNLLQLQSPFPQSNRLNIIIPKTSTKFTQRSEGMWREIAENVKKVVLAVPGNIAVFFPSYAILQNVHRFLESGMPKTILAEQPGMSKDEKAVFLNKFKAYSGQGAVLLGVISGNYGEGIDLPGDLLQGVVVVGLPLGKPDLETKALISYFDQKCGAGWDFGYTIPAFNKTLQSAGRCIRTETDKGVIVFLDERYEWPRYVKLFPKEWKMKSTILYEKMIKDFFSGGGSQSTLI